MAIARFVGSLPTVASRRGSIIEILCIHRSPRGRYLDASENRAGSWGIVDRVVIHDWSDAHELTLYPDLQNFAEGATLDDGITSGPIVARRGSSRAVSRACGS